MEVAANHSIQPGGDVAGSSEGHERAGVGRLDAGHLSDGRSGGGRSRPAAAHFSLYSVRGAPRTLDHSLAAGSERAVSGRILAVNGRGQRA